MSAKKPVDSLSPSGQTKASVIKRIHKLLDASAPAEPSRTSSLPEERAGRLATVLSMLASIQEAASRSENRDGLLNETCRLAQDAGEYVIARVILIDPKTRIAQIVARAADDLLDKEWPGTDPGVADESLVGRVIRVDQAVICDDINRTPFVISEQDRRLMSAAGVLSLACLPLHIDKTPVGALLCGMGTTGVLGPEELLLLEEVAASVSSALQRLHDNALQADGIELAARDIKSFEQGELPRRIEMRDSFDYETYWSIIERLSRTNQPLRFADLADGLPTTPFFILRHDVDYSPAAALDLAYQEARRGVRCTYFLLLNSFYYNLLTPEHASFPARLVAMGHEVGLHYDVKFLEAFPRQRWPELIRAQATLLGDLSGTRVTAIAMHQPGLNREDPLRYTEEYMNAYADRFCREMPYFSDSCRAWWDTAWEMLASGCAPLRFQLALHPINWAERDRDRKTIFRSLHRDLARTIEAAGDELLRKIADHGGVLQHQAREARR
jgi:GAF domain